jgi:pyruvate formate lyase activating enzyme
MSATTTSAVIFDIERYATKDGPGIRTVIFLKGCNLRGQWCQNPESQCMRPQIMYYINLCQGCGRCLDLCPNQAIRRDDMFGLVTDPELCTACGLCAEQCYVEARKLMGSRMTVAEIMEEIRKDQPYYESSGGGITFSGGEPLLYPDFVREVARQCQEEGIHTAIETAGHVAWEVFEQVLPYLNLVFFDIKHLDPECHKRYTGVTNERILRNLQQLSEVFAPIIIRVPVIPGCNDSIDVQQRIYEFVKGLRGVERVELLPYHRLGSSKYKGLGREYPFAGVDSLKKDEIAHLVKLGQTLGVPVQIGAE